MNIQLRWWFLFNLTIAVAAILVFQGWHVTLYAADVTKISFLIIGIFFTASSYVGLIAHGRGSAKGKEFMWFLTEAMLTLGMIGTVAGFIVMLGGTFSELNVEDIHSVRSALIQMVVGMSTALYTTLVGLVCSQALKLHLFSIEKEMEK